MTDIYSKLPRAVPPGEISSSRVANVFFDSWIVPYGILVYILTENGVQFTSKLLAALCKIRVVKNLTTTACYPQTNEHIARYNRTISTTLRYNVAKNQKDWDTYVQPFIYAYSAEVQKLTNTTPYSLMLS